ncbi:MAG: hypothetical protein K1X83_14025 [Oligoflexia bacterium]|nr:hypothetical protein [Oligoflexia bacterium]
MRVILLCMLLCWASAGTAQACSCLEMPVEAGLERSDVVFAGRIVKIEPVYLPSRHPGPGKTVTGAEEPIVVTFQVLRSWKGDTTKTIVLHTHREFSACIGLMSQYCRVGAELLVYAYNQPWESWSAGENDRAPEDAAAIGRYRKASGRTQRLTSNICTRTRELAGAAEDLAKLGAGQEPRGR